VLIASLMFFFMLSTSVISILKFTGHFDYFDINFEWRGFLLNFRRKTLGGSITQVNGPYQVYLLRKKDIEGMHWQ
jgi:hypothetical protein